MPRLAFNETSALPGLFFLDHCSEDAVSSRVFISRQGIIDPAKIAANCDNVIVVCLRRLHSRVWKGKPRIEFSPGSRPELILG